MRRLKWLWLLLLPLLWFAAYEPVETVVHGAPPLQVRANQHAAASRLLEDWGLETRRILSPGSLFPLPDTDSLLILKSNRGALAPSRAEQLRAWVARGGRLLVTARPLPRGRDQNEAEIADWQRNDPLLFPLAITAWRTEAPEPRPSATAIIEQYLDAGALFQQLCMNATEEMMEECEDVMCRHHLPWHESRLATNGEPRRLGLDAGTAIRHPHLEQVPRLPAPSQSIPTALRYQAGNEWGQQLVSLALGDGELIVVTDLSLWDNDHLHLLDHAWWLRRVSGDLKRVWFVQNMDMPSLGRWLWREAWPVIVALALVLVLFLWREIPRQTTLLSATSGRSRDFLEHLAASSRFLWRTDNQQVLLGALRRQVRKRLAGHPVPAGDNARHRYLARYADTTEERVARALTQRPDTREELIDFVATLQLLRSRL